MAKMKKETSRSASFAQGGSGKMFGKQTAGSQKAGGTAHAVSGGGGTFAKGGSTKMHGFRGAEPATSGITSPC